MSSDYTPDFRSLVGDFFRLLAKSPAITGSYRQLVDAAHIGVCLLFLATMLDVQRLDTPLSVASIAFVGALPLLGFGFLGASYKFEPTPAVRPGGRSVVYLRDAMPLATYLLESTGVLVVWGGMVAVAWHYGFAALIAGAGVVVIVVLILAGTYLALARQSAREAQPRPPDPPVS
jgi:hypothetical protein